MHPPVHHRLSVILTLSPCHRLRHWYWYRPYVSLSSAHPISHHLVYQSQGRYLDNPAVDADTPCPCPPPHPHTCTLYKNLHTQNDQDQGLEAPSPTQQPPKTECESLESPCATHPSEPHTRSAVWPVWPSRCRSGLISSRDLGGAWYSFSFRLWNLRYVGCNLQVRLPLLGVYILFYIYMLLRCYVATLRLTYGGLG